MREIKSLGVSSTKNKCTLEDSKVEGNISSPLKKGKKGEKMESTLLAEIAG